LIAPVLEPAEMLSIVAPLESNRALPVSTYPVTGEDESSLTWSPDPITSFSWLATASILKEQLSNPRPALAISLIAAFLFMAVPLFTKGQFLSPTGEMLAPFHKSSCRAFL
jgi:hypothetical protein